MRGSLTLLDLFAKVLKHEIIKYDPWGGGHTKSTSAESARFNRTKCKIKVEEIDIYYY